MLTAKQRDLLVFLKQAIRLNTNMLHLLMKMKNAIGLKSKSGIHRLVSALEERGYIRRLANRARAIEIIDEPTQHRAFRIITRRIAMSFMLILHKSTSLSLPLGQIAAGTPIEALSDHSRFLDVPASMVGTGEHFALEIVGDSMVEAGIHDGDTVVIKKT